MGDNFHAGAGVIQLCTANPRFYALAKSGLQLATKCLPLPQAVCLGLGFHSPWFQGLTGVNGTCQCWAHRFTVHLFTSFTCTPGSVTALTYIVGIFLFFELWSVTVIFRWTVAMNLNFHCLRLHHRLCMQPRWLGFRKQPVESAAWYQRLLYVLPASLTSWLYVITVLSTALLDCYCFFHRF